MVFRLAVCAAALLAAGCSPKAAPGVSGGVIQQPSGPMADAGAAQKRMPLPDCKDVEATDAGAAGSAHKHCRLMSTDKAGLAFEARYSPPKEGEQTTVTIQVVAPGDATLQTITEKMDNTFGAPSLQDIDKDGRDELLVPLSTGNVNTNWAVWRATGDGKQYKRVEELSGVSIEHTDSGYIAVAARSSAAEWGVGFWKFDGEDLEPIATADVKASTKGWDAIDAVECSVEDAGGLKELKLSAKEADKLFCGEKVVKDLFEIGKP